MRFMTSFLRRLRNDTGANAFMMVAAGLPALIGGTGFAVDMSQWYMWKSELQNAVDQAALAGAYARTSEETEPDYSTRAVQEYWANLSATDDIASSPTVTLTNWATGSNNSVVVTASAYDKLPFTSFLTDRGTTVRVSSQAAFEKGVTYTSCLVAVDEDAEGAITIGGSAQFIAGCGIAALSNSEEAIRVNGSPTIEAGWLIAAGGIDDWFDTNTNDTVLENQEGLVDPFAELTPPTNNTARTYSCPKGKTTVSYLADSVSTTTSLTYTYHKKSGNNYPTVNYSGPYKKTNTSSTSTSYNVSLSALPTSSTTTSTTDSGYEWIDGSGNSKIYQRTVTTTTTKYVNAREKTTTEAAGAAVLQPGTYSDLTLKCDTVFTSGIYVISGGSLTIHSQYNVTGSGVMFVLKDGAGIQINGGSNVNLTAMTTSQLEAAGVSAEDAVKLAGMLIFEDRNSSGNSKNKINGNTSTILNGTVYLPVSNLDLAGSAGVTAQCLMLVASTITLTGNVEMTSFCPPDLEEESVVLSTQDRVRLVS